MKTIDSGAVTVHLPTFTVEPGTIVQVVEACRTAQSAVARLVKIVSASCMKRKKFDNFASQNMRHNVGLPRISISKQNIESIYVYG